MKNAVRLIVACVLGAVPVVMLGASPARAEVLASGPTGFVVEHRVEFGVEAASAYEAFIAIGSWWSSAHSFSGDAKNLTIDARPGGCWCETLPNGGFVEHLRVVHAAPGSMLVFSGGLGPLQSMGVAGALTVSFRSVGTGMTTVALRYDVGGRDAKDLLQMAPAVDGVLSEQIARYRRFVATGTP